MNIEVIVTPDIINVVVTPRIIEVVVTPQAPFVVSLDPGGVAAAQVAQHAALPYAHHSHANKTDLDAYDPALFDLAGTAATALTAHLNAVDPHSQYLQADDLPPEVTRDTLGIATNDEVTFGGVIIPGLIAGTAYRIIIDGDGTIGTEQVL